MKKYINNFLDMIFFHHSYIVKISVAIGYFILFIFAYTSFFGNPFTSPNHSRYVHDYYLTPNIDSIEKDYKKRYSIPHLDEDLSYYVYKILDDQKTVEVYDSDYNDAEEAWDNDALYIVNIDSLRNDDVHPLPFFTKSNSNNDIFIFGTNYSGEEVFNSIIYNFKNTFYLIIYSVLGFLISGVFLGVINGYYKYNYFAKIFILLQKLIESVPLMLWVLFTVVTVNFLIPAQNKSYEWPIIYFLFGIFASTALSKLIAEKIDALREQEFIIALKLLGLSDYAILFRHVIRYYCLDIVMFQLINIVSQSIFLNITLCIIEFKQANTIGIMFSKAFFNRNSMSSFVELIIISILIYFIMNSLFYTARYFKDKM